MRTIAVIPARYQSGRFPGKLLAKLKGQSLIQHVYERTQLANRVDSVLVATDDERILDTVQSFGGEVVMTSRDHHTGSDRVAEAVLNKNVDLVVNVQGDEVLIEPKAIDQAIEFAETTPDTIVTLKSAITDISVLMDKNVVKVVTDHKDFALYFSRAPIPVFQKEDITTGLFFKHIGIYVYPKKLLLAFANMHPTKLEQAESLEQLRALENGIRIRVHQTNYDSISINTMEDLSRVSTLS